MVIITRGNNKNNKNTKIEVSLNNGNKIQIKLYLFETNTHTHTSYLYHNRTRENKTAHTKKGNILTWRIIIVLSLYKFSSSSLLNATADVVSLFLFVPRDADWELMVETFVTSSDICIDEQLLNCTQVTCTRILI